MSDILDLLQQVLSMQLPTEARGGESQTLNPMDKMCGVEKQYNLHDFGGKRPASDSCADLEHLMSLALRYITVQLKSRPLTKAISKKNNELASKFRQMGDKASLSTRIASLKEALESYAKSIAYAVPGSEEMALCYATRSALFLKLNLPDESLQDIQRALQLNCPENFKPNLLFRRAECFEQLSLNNYTTAKLWLSKVPPNDANHKIIKQRLMKYPLKENRIVDEMDVIPKITSSNEKFPCASDSIDVQYSPSLGRHVVATRDIDVGEILVVEMMYMKALDKAELYTHCSYCLRYLLTCLPCDRCSEAVYCSETCQKTAWEKYHEYECGLISQFEREGIFSQSICVKLLMDMIHKAGGVENLQERVKAFEERSDGTKWPLNDKWYQSASLETILTLTTGLANMPSNALIQVAVNVSRVLFYLVTCNNFLNISYDRETAKDADILTLMLRDPNVTFVGGLLMKLSLILKNNSIAVSEVDSESTNSIGAALMSFISLLNHSCAINSFRQFKQDHVVLHALLPIKKGEEITTSYGMDYYRIPRKSRQLHLKSRYSFDCTCPACKGDWPKYLELRSFEKSPRCRGQIKSAIATCNQIWIRVMDRDLRDREKITHQLYKTLKMLLKEAATPCKEVQVIILTYGHWFMCQATSEACLPLNFSLLL